MRYTFGLGVGLTLLGVLIYCTIVSPEDFDPPFTLYLSYAIVLAANIGLIYHAYTWYKAVKDKENRA